MSASAQLKKTANKYLANYAEQEVTNLSSFPQAASFQHVVVIPAFQETKAFIERFTSSVLAKQQCLFIVVINQPDSDYGREHAQAQLDLARSIIEIANPIWQQGNLCLAELNNTQVSDDLNMALTTNSSVLIVDRYSHPIPAEQGVGLARKIGADLAATLSLNGNVKSPWIHSTDADATLPDNYLLAHHSTDKLTHHCVVTCCNFYHHSAQAEIHQANELYEMALRYYVAGLHYAKSPYAYFTIGSILSFDVFAYCQARGFPKRSAGEDFYLLNKLAKLGSIEFLPEVTIKLDARPSQRVPFGTGPAVKSIMALSEQNLDYQYYNPEVFVELKASLSAFKCLWQYREQPEQWFKKLTPIAHKAFIEIGLLSFIKKQKHANQTQFDKQLTVWFDSFKTLKFIHALREYGLKNIALLQAIEIAPFKLEG